MSDNWRAKCLSLQSGINPEHSLRITKAVLDLEPFPVKIFLKSILQAETGKEKRKLMNSGQKQAFLLMEQAY